MFVKKGVVIPLGGVGTFDAAGVYLPTSIKHNNKFYVYYCGKDAAAKYRIGLAISEDGMNFVKKGVVIPIGGAGEFDHDSLYGSAAIKCNNKIYLYYEAWDAAYRIGLAISEDGMNFVKKGVVIPLGAGGAFDDRYVYLPSVVRHNNKIYMYYSGTNVATGARRIGLAISEDGMNFVKKGVVIPIGGAGTFDGLYALDSAPIILNNKFYVYYLGRDVATSKYRIGLAISEDGMNFVKKGVVIPIGAGGAFDDNFVFAFSIIKHNDKIYLYYSGEDGGTYRTGLAISDDGM